MLSKRYYQQGAATDFASFFGSSRRLALLQHLLPQISDLHETLNRPLTILDVGAGTGVHADFIAGMGHEVTAVEPVEEMIQEGKKRYHNPNLNFVVDSLPELKNINGQFDIIYSIAAWQYIEPKNRQAAMNRIAELLKPGGVFVIVWPIPMSREFQFPLSEEEMTVTIKTVNKNLSEQMQIQVATGSPIADPDGRCGFVETTEKVFFYTVMGRIPAFVLHLENDASQEKYISVLTK